jgi:hypothetical protein
VPQSAETQAPGSLAPPASPGPPASPAARPHTHGFKVVL